MNIQKNIPLAPLSTFGIGGIAKEYIQVRSLYELIELVRRLKRENKRFKVFAGGSNVVFPDSGLDDLLIQILGGEIRITEENMMVDGGVLLSDVVSSSIGAGLSGVEYLSGIPGTIGGAIVGNAGAYGHSISEVVEKVEIFDGEKRYWINREECNFSYRESIFKRKPYLILRAILKFEQGDKEELERISKEIIKKREMKYHPGIRCPGSFFKNIIATELNDAQLKNIDKKRLVYGKVPAGYLLEEVGAKGMKVGGIKIADYHGNLFINEGSGTASQVKQLADILKQKVWERFGIALSEEIRYF